MAENDPSWDAYEEGMNGQDWHIPEDEEYTTVRSTEPVTVASRIPLVFTPANDDPNLFVLVSPKGACSITYTPELLLPGTATFAHEIFDLTSHRCHGYAGRPKGDRGPSGEGWKGIYLKLDPIYDSADRKRLLERGGRGWSMAVEKNPVEGLVEALVITGSDTLYALFLLTEAMGLSPWHRWQRNRPPWKTDVAIKRDPHARGRMAGGLPPLGQTLTMNELAQEQWESIAQVAEERDVEENIDNLIWTAIRLGKDVISLSVLEFLKITDHASREKIDEACSKVGVKVV